MTEILSMGEKRRRTMIERYGEDWARKSGLKAAATIKENHGEDFYRRIGAVGGKNGHTSGFAVNRELARIAGAKGGRISRRTKKQDA